MRFLIICLLLLSTVASNAQKDVSLKITHLQGDFYVFTTYNYYQNTRIGANGMYVVTKAGVLMIDSPWDTTQFQPLLDSIYQRHQKKVIFCIATHFHEDRTGGLEYYSSRGIDTYTTRKTDSLSIRKGMKQAAHLLNNDTTFSIGGYTFETYYPGHGHAPDNIVIWFNHERILYGGCLVKSMDDNTLGNLGDADVQAYPTTLKNVLLKYKNPQYIIPGHNSWRNKRSLKHTLKMAILKRKKSF